MATSRYQTHFTLFAFFLLTCATMLSSGCNGSNDVNTVNKVQMGGAIQGVPLSLTKTVTTLAGTAVTTGSIDGNSAAARFYSPTGITTDGMNLYVSDSSNQTIRKVVISTGTVSTLAGTAGTIGSADGTSTTASFHSPSGITTDGTNLYVSDGLDNTIRKIEISTGAVTTLAGTASSIGSTDGIGAAARFSSPEGITTDGVNLYVTDTTNSTIRKIVISTGSVTTLAGTAVTTGSADGNSAAARFYSPTGITTDGTNLYVTDTFNSTIRKIVIATGAVSTLAGTAGIPGSTDGIGAAASFFFPTGISTDGTNLYVTEMMQYPLNSGHTNAPSHGNNAIRKIELSTGTVTTLAGSVGTTGATDGIGAAATFYIPSGITTDGTNLYVTDTGNNTIRAIH